MAPRTKATPEQAAAETADHRRTQADRNAEHFRLGECQHLASWVRRRGYKLTRDDAAIILDRRDEVSLAKALKAEGAS